MDTTAFRSVGAGQMGAAVSTLASAFRADPVERWLYPGGDQYVRDFPRFVVAFGGRAFDQNTAWASNSLSAVALWLPPGVEPDGQAVVAVLTETVAADQHDELYDVLGQMDEAHPAYPHWYLPWLGVAAEAQGGGLGGQLLAHCLDHIDSSGLPSYLETPNPRTVGLYERHGFTVSGVTRSASCPPITLMARAGSADSARSSIR